MFGREELERLALKKEALLAESGLNRAALRVELDNLRSAAAGMREAAQVPRGFMRLLLLLAPGAGFLLARGVCGRNLWLDRAAAAVRWIGPLYDLWKRLSPGKAVAEGEQQRG